MRRKGFLLTGMLCAVVGGCATPPNYYDAQGPVVTGGTPYAPYNTPQPGYGYAAPPAGYTVQPGYAAPPGGTMGQPTLPPAGGGFVGQPTPAKMQPLPPSGAPMN